FDTTRHLYSVETLLYWIPTPVEQTILVLAEQVWLLALLLACIAALSTIIWIASLSIGSRLGRPLVPAQSLMIALWPQWIILGLLPLALVIPSFSQPIALKLVQVLFLGYLVGYAWTILRVLLDYNAACRGPIWLTVLVGLANPPVLLLALGVLFTLPRTSYVGFLLHIMTRS
ncbi:MAG: hypothetical protein HKN13_13925, partial [Rhodothermales bacterium]|nr:hypothetical protein [Rhodothermales bacterium]